MFAPLKAGCGIKYRAKSQTLVLKLLGIVDDERRHQLMRTHTAMHILCGVMWQRWQRVVTGGNMDTLSGRMDFELDEFPPGSQNKYKSYVTKKSQPIDP